MDFYFLLFLAGLIGGLISGLLGVGGGIIYILILPIAFQFIGIPNQEIAQFTIANSLFGTFFAGLFATYNHYKHGEFYPKQIIIISISSITAGLLSLYFIVNTPFYSVEVFNVVVIVLLGLMLFSTLSNAKKQVDFQETSVRVKRLLSLTGLSAGLTASLTGLGGGIIIIPFLNQGFKMGVKKAKAISLGVITITSLSMVVFNLFQQPMQAVAVNHTGYILFQVTGPLIVGTLITARIGVKLSRKMKASAVSYLFSAFIVLVIVKKLLELI
ncbi:sulfite exporter TauE/SafE family protein [Marivirga harenae]|uniref:sulfite exporter TauE/SafE family protein n=1 Tax=Marivirga harenae TaxID=2010992 RepID=UPI0026E0B7FD|nr:sulfite exporter TauE/SafE family protein [Marivirga harenae]WKV12653.1 sulfite exporter TauE/SafE family protein [Marivirga harenae]|tara:strand:+ start:37815 stop:38627 length:813 start_codon:yes stop_codon:yes gene_type:complete